jgi:GDP-L-fucose synthase
VPVGDEIILVGLTGIANPDARAWRGTAVAVTGGDGFLGRVLVRALRELDADVRAVHSSEHDLRTAEGAREAVDGAEVVFHLAARVGGIGFNVRHPALLIHDNLLLATHVFEQSRLAGVGRLVAVSSVCAYPELPPLPFSERDLWSGYPEPSNAPYGIAKRVLETLSEAYWREHGLCSCTPILTNLYGPGDHDDPCDSHVIPALIRKLVLAEARPGETVVVWGTGRATRDLLFVEDAARALILAAERTDRPFVVNIGSGSEHSIGELVSELSELIGFRGEIVWDRDKPDGQRRRRVDVSRAREILGFEATVPLHEGLRRTVAAFPRQELVDTVSREHRAA